MSVVVPPLQLCIMFVIVWCILQKHLALCIIIRSVHYDVEAGLNSDKGHLVVKTDSKLF